MTEHQQAEFGLQPLISTKLYMPPAHESRVRRVRLTARLTQMLCRRVVLISAPAGFGKSTLLSDWKAEYPEMARSLAWLSLDSGDNDFSRFLSYVVAAIQAVEPAVGESALVAVQSHVVTPPETVLALLLNDLARIEERCILALDDYDVIQAPAVHEGLAYLIQRLPPNFHLVILSRTDPPLALARVRALGELAELHSGDLSFSLEESIEFLTKVMQIPLSNDEVARLHAQTEGWIAGLHLVALSMRGREAGAPVAPATASRYVFDYLAEQVLDRQPAHLQQFLLRTSILSRLCAPLCDAVSGSTGSQATLERLEHDNVFVVALDSDRRWYRYHPLFAEMLQHRLARGAQLEPGTLHRRARVWFEEAQLYDEAIHHSLESRDIDDAARLIERRVMPTIMRGELSTVLVWLNSLPDAVVRSSARLSVAYAWALLLATDLNAIEPRLQDASRLLSSRSGTPLAASRLSPEPDDSPTGAQALRGQIAAIRAYAAQLRDDTERSILLARRALELLPKRNMNWRGTTASILGDSYARSDNAPAASGTYRDAIDMCERSGDVFALVVVLKDLGRLQIAQGQLRAAEATFERGLRLAARGSAQEPPYAGYAHSGIGEVLYERNELDAAERHLVRGIELCEAGGFGENAIRGAIVLAKLYLARGDPERVNEALRRAQGLAQRTGLSRAASLVASQVALLQAQSGDLESAGEWAESSGLLGGEPAFALETEYLALARLDLLMAEAIGEPSRIADSLRILEALRVLAERGRRAGSEVAILATQSVALRASGELRRALAALDRALTLAQPEGYVRTFVDLGRPMRSLLTELLRGLVPPLVKMVHRLLRAFPEQTDSEEVPSALFEPLSGRELAVLRLAAAGLSNQQIADELQIALSTVKVHLHTIYGKLHAGRRVEAIVRARELHIL